MSRYDTGPPCSSRAVDAFLRMGMAGLSWGLFMGSYDAGKQGHAGIPRAIFVSKAVLKNCLGWGGFGGMYMGLHCGFEALRMKRDWKNAMLAGFLTGAMAASLKSNSKMLLTGCVTAAITSSLDMVNPIQYPSGGVDIRRTSKTQCWTEHEQV